MRSSFKSRCTLRTDTPQRSAVARTERNSIAASPLLQFSLLLYAGAGRDASRSICRTVKFSRGV